MAVQKQDDQHEHTFSNYVRIRDVVLKTYLGRWTIGRSGERVLGISVLTVRDDDDDDDDDDILFNNNFMAKTLGCVGFHGNADNTKNTYDFLVQARNFLLPLSLKVFRHKERDTHDFSICPKPRAHPTQGHSEQAKVNRLLPRQDSTQLTDFFKSPKIFRARFRCMTSFTSSRHIFYLGFLFWHLWTTHPPRARVNTCAQVCT